MIDETIKLFVLFVVIFDPFLSSASFVSLTSGFSEDRKRSVAAAATALASFLVLIFLLSGNLLLELMSVKMTDFQIAGGIILAILGVRMVLGQEITEHKKADGAAAIATVIATPLITGPAAITTTVISVAQYGMFTTGIAVFGALFVVFIALYFSTFIYKKTGPTFASLFSTMLGLVTLAWGVAFVRQGLGMA